MTEIKKISIWSWDSGYNGYGHFWLYVAFVRPLMFTLIQVWRMKIKRNGWKICTRWPVLLNLRSKVSIAYVQFFSSFNFCSLLFTADLGLEEFIHHAFRPTSMLGMNKRFEDPFNPKIHRAYYSRMALGSL